jgi:hypothetical protein
VEKSQLIDAATRTINRSIVTQPGVAADLAFVILVLLDDSCLSIYTWLWDINRCEVHTIKSIPLSMSPASVTVEGWGG